MLGIGDVTCELTKNELAKKSKKIDAGSYPTLFSSLFVDSLAMEC